MKSIYPKMSSVSRAFRDVRQKIETLPAVGRVSISVRILCAGYQDIVMTVPSLPSSASTAL